MNSVICHPLDGEKILTNSILIEGYAIATGDCTIKCVELSTDGGEIWIQRASRITASQGLAILVQPDISKKC
ncbi:MAG: hypothetical protein V7K33_27615 [Nostoc sp.]